MKTAYSLNEFLEHENPYRFSEIFMVGKGETIAPETLEKVFTYKHIERFYIENVTIAQIPDNIHQCSALKSLTFNNIKGVSKLPDTLGQLPFLDSLHLENSNFESLPDSICDLPNLSFLDCENIPLQSLPARLGNLPKLRTLLFRNIHLPELPESFRQCTTLQRLYLQNTQLSSIPAVLLAIPTINYVELNDNKISYLPQEMTNWKELGCLIISNNTIVELPDFWDKFPNLGRLECTRNLLKKIPKSIATLHNLSNLYIENNPLTTFPEAVLFLDSLVNMLTDSKQKALFAPAFIQNYAFRDWYTALRKARSPHEYRISLYTIFGNMESSLKDVPLAHLLEALRLRHVPTSINALREIATRATAMLAKNPLKKGCEVVMVGDCAFKKAELKTKLQAKGIAYVPKLKTSTTHVLIGKNLDSWEDLDRSDLVFLTDQQMNDFLNQGEDLYLLTTENQAIKQENSQNVNAMLASTDEASIEIALQILQTGKY